MPGPVKAALRGDLWLSTPELDDIVRAHVARSLGIPGPVLGTVSWMWSPGKGPVAHVQVEHVPNVACLSDRRAMRGRRR